MSGTSADARSASTHAHEPYQLEIELEGLPHLQSGTWGHWAKRRKHDEQWKQIVRFTVGVRHLYLRDAHVDCIRFSNKEPDYDNLVSSFKPLIDGLIEAAVIMDDSPTHLTRNYSWCESKRGQGRVRLIVTERRP